MSENPHVEALNLRHLMAWLAVVEEGSVTAGARKLGVSQPALSQQLRALEDFFGSELLERLHRGVQPTQLGRALLADARATVAAATRLSRQARSIAGLQAGVLEIATLPTLVDAIMIDPIRRWQAKYPDVTIRIREFAQQSEMTEVVAMGEADLAIGVRPPRWAGPVVSLGWEQFALILPPNDPLAGESGPIDLKNLSDRQWVQYEPSNGLAEYVVAACTMAGFRPIIAVQTSQVQVAVHLAMAGLGAVLVPSANVPPELSDAARQLTPPITWELAAYTRTTIPTPAAVFIDLVRNRDWLSLAPDAIVLPGS